MHAAIITPQDNLFNFSHLTKFDMVVPDHFTGPQGQFRKEQAQSATLRGHYIILDNGTYERGVALKGNELMALAKEVYASEIVVPDYWKHRSLTHRAVHGFLEEHWEHIQEEALHVMIVPQGEDVQDWIEGLEELQYTMRRSYTEYGLLPSRIIWGIPKWLSEEENRLDLVNKLPQRLEYHKASYYYKYHLLGLSKLSELLHFKGPISRHIRGIDTSLPVKAAIERRGLFEENPVAHGVGFMHAVMDTGLFNVACHNVVQTLSVVPQFKQYQAPGL